MQKKLLSTNTFRYHKRELKTHWTECNRLFCNACIHNRCWKKLQLY